MEPPVTIEFNGVKYHRNPDSKRRSHRVYYQHHFKWKETPHYLHKDIWVFHNGEILKGYVIHHKDGNPFNNDITNLELMLAGKHNSKHTLEWFSNPENREKQLKHLKEIRPLTTEWHKSELGLEWHRQNAIKCGFGKKKN